MRSVRLCALGVLVVLLLGYPLVGHSATRTSFPQEYYPMRDPIEDRSTGCTAATLNAAITAAGSTQQLLWLSPVDGNTETCTWTLDADVTVPSTLGLWWPQGTQVCPASGKTLTINGPLLGDPMHQLKATGCAGKIVFGPNTPELHASWWGAATNTTLAAAVADIGAASKTLAIDGPTTWSITADVTIPSNIRAAIPFGATVTIANTKTLTLAACPNIDAPGWLTGATAGKVVITAPGCPIEVHKFSTSGAGTQASPWTGWDSVLDWTQSEKSYEISTGFFAFNSAIVITGQHVHFSGTGTYTSRLVWTGAATTGALVFGDGGVAYQTITSTLRDFALTATDVSATKIGIKLVDFSGSTMERVAVQNWTGSESTALLIQGRDTSTFRDLVLYAPWPLRFEEDPVAKACYNFTPSQCGMDSSTFTNLYLAGEVGGGRACIKVGDRANLSSIRFTGYQSWNLCDNGFLWEDTLSTIFVAPSTITGVRHEQNTADAGWIIKISRSSGTGAIQGLTISDVLGGNKGNGIYLVDAVQGTTQIRNFVWAMGSTAGVPIYFDPGIYSTVLDIQGGLFGGDGALNAGGINPCTGAGGAPTGTHSCIKEMRVLTSANVLWHKYLDESNVEHDFGPSTYFVNKNDTVVFPTPTYAVAGTVFRFPVAGLSQPNVSSVGGSLTTSTEVVPFITLIDCPTDLDPCAGTFKIARLFVTVASSDFSTWEWGEFVVKPVVAPNTPAGNNEVVCVVCSANMVANNPGVAGKFWVYHAEFTPTSSPTQGFFAFANDLGVTVNWMATLTVLY